ncbi:uncharacterized protein IL334_003183 [Kwoniella shivajii]|uniref:Mediator complex subunit 1 n=1 Tax=Kwoniella shivajii TaxID=564305 RepID=A0ABZ1CYI3_9TREE|nr:hypothetical protein IL334_003183 [Kwoniella shivajii]
MSIEEADIPSATPLDLLINAIAGSTDYIYPPPSYQDHLPRETNNVSVAQLNEGRSTHLDDFISTKVGDPSNASNFMRQLPSPTPRHKEIAKTLYDHIVKASAETTDPSEGSSSQLRSDRTVVEVWHPITGQKSYGKERRIIAPPPKLCIAGPLASSISSVTLSTTSERDSAPSSSSQTHLIASSSTSPLSDTLAVGGIRAERQDRKRKFREAARTAGFGATLPKVRSNVEGKNRDVLEDGLNFPGLWIGDEIGKNKEFCLELKVNIENPQQAETAINLAEDRTEIDRAVQQDIENGTFDGIDPVTSLSEELDPSSIEVLQPLAEAVQQVNEAARQTLAAHLPDIASSAFDQPQADSQNQLHNEAEYKPPTLLPYATFLSSPLKVVSKPSQKTAKARSMTSCFSINSSFALWTRIHAQTVRTKYMNLETNFNDKEGEARLTSKTGKWTPFKFQVIYRASPPPIEKKEKNKPNGQNENISSVIEVLENEDILTYGSIVILVDLQSGIKSDPVKIVKIDSGEAKVGENEGHPISELQRIGLVRLNHNHGMEDMKDGGRWYLSAPGARLGGGELNLDGKSSGRGGRARPSFAPKSSKTIVSEKTKDVIPPPETLNNIEAEDTSAILASENRLPQDEEKRDQGEHSDEPPKKKKKTKRNALAAAVLAEDEDGGMQTVLSWVKADREEQGAFTIERSEDKRGTFIDVVEEWMSWIIGGVACSSYSFFPASDSRSPLLQAEKTSMNPVPRILIPPTFDSENNTLDLTISQFDFPSISNSAEQEQCEIYLGPIGPLYTTLWRSTAPKDTPTLAIPYVPESNQDGRVFSTYPADKTHAIAQVTMPNAEKILEVMQDLARKVQLRKFETSSTAVDRGDNHVVTTINDTQVDVNGTTETGQVIDQRQEDTWFDHSHQAEEDNRSNELSITQALEMAPEFNALHDLGPFEDDLSSIVNTNTQEHGENHRDRIDPSSVARTGEGDVIDPSLRDYPEYIPSIELSDNLQQQEPPQEQEQGQGVGKDNYDTIRLYTPEKSNSTPGAKDKDGQNELIPLPFVLVRNDGMIFEIGKQVVATLIQNDQDKGENGSEGVREGVKWGLRVV